MDTPIGNYQVRIEKQGLILTHPTKFSFDFTIEETLRLAAFIKIYRSALIATQHDKEPTTKENHNQRENSTKASD